LFGLLLRAEKDKRMRLYERGLTLTLSWRRGNSTQNLMN
jgi:hypothetical protein